MSRAPAVLLGGVLPPWLVPVAAFVLLVVLLLAYRPPPPPSVPV